MAVDVLEHVGIVKAIANRINLKTGKRFEAADLVQEGMLGLLDAAKRYRPELGVKFSTFATRRVHGAIWDKVRERCQGRREMKAFTRSLNERIEPDNAESEELWANTPDASAINGLQACLSAEMRMRLEKAISMLPANQQKLLAMYYADEPLSMAEIGERLGCSTSNVSYQHTSAMKTLRKRLAA